MMKCELLSEQGFEGFCVQEKEGVCKDCTIARDAINRRNGSPYPSTGPMVGSKPHAEGASSSDLVVEETYQEGSKRVTFTLSVRAGVYHDEKHI
jgi:hypothetical protein